MANEPDREADLDVAQAEWALDEQRQRRHDDADGDEVGERRRHHQRERRSDQTLPDCDRASNFLQLVGESEEGPARPPYAQRPSMAGLFRSAGPAQDRQQLGLRARAFVGVNDGPRRRRTPGSGVPGPWPSRNKPRRARDRARVAADRRREVPAVHEVIEEQLGGIVLARDLSPRHVDGAFERTVFLHRDRSLPC